MQRKHQRIKPQETPAVKSKLISLSKVLLQALHDNNVTERDAAKEEMKVYANMRAPTAQFELARYYHEAAACCADEKEKSVLLEKRNSWLQEAVINQYPSALMMAFKIKSGKYTVIDKLLKLRLIVTPLELDPGNQIGKFFKTWCEARPEIDNKMREITCAFKRVLTEQKAMENYKKTLSGVPLYFQPGLCDADTKLLSKFLDDYPVVLDFLKKLLGPDNSYLEQVYAEFYKNLGPGFDHHGKKRNFECTISALCSLWSGAAKTNKADDQDQPALKKQKIERPYA